MARGEELTDEQWTLVKELLPELPRRSDGRGRPWRSQRQVLNGVLWILRSGARWKDLPERFPAVPDLPPPLPGVGGRRCAARHPRSLGRGPARTRPDRSLRVLHRRHVHRGEKRGPAVGPTKRGKGTKLMVMADAAGLPVAAHTAVLARLKSPLSKRLWKHVSFLHDQSA